ncbi:sigma-70 family RNA polymerase sigma factor [soil metagenome]
MEPGRSHTPVRNIAAQDADREVLERLASGDLDALEELYDRYRALAYGIALRITTDTTRAEDAVQEAFLGMWRNAARYDGRKGSVKTWLLSIVHHRSVDSLRRRRPTVEIPNTDLAAPASLTVADVWGEVAARLDADEVRSALGGLPPAQRECIELAYFDGLTQQEIAARTSTPLGTVKGRMRLGLLSLRRTLLDPANRGAVAEERGSVMT